MSRRTSEWQILSFCSALKLRYRFMCYATLSLGIEFQQQEKVDTEKQ